VILISVVKENKEIKNIIFLGKIEVKLQSNEVLLKVSIFE